MAKLIGSGDNIYTMAANHPPGKGQQAGRSGALQSELKAAAYGISGQWRSADFQQPGRERHPPLYPWQKELAVLRYYKESRGQRNCVFPG